jgi:hydrogenase nickel incorporation protein HypB
MCATCGCNSNDPAMILNPNELSVNHSHDHHHEHYAKEKTVIDLERDVLEKNNLTAQRLRGYFEAKTIFAVNLVSSPGSGKTTLLEKTLAHLTHEFPCAVIEGDQQTSFDAERIHALGVPVIQINTGKGCHLDAEMIHRAVHQLNLADGSILFIENVGNLVCPAMFDLGESARVVIMSVTEGDDKPAKYPDMFHSSNLCVINKIDLLPYVNFNLERCKDFLQRVTHHIGCLEVSATRGDGLGAWLEWLVEQKQQGIYEGAHLSHSH